MSLFLLLRLLRLLRPPPPTRGRYCDQTRLEPDDVYIGRGSRRRGGKILAPSQWGNPFRVASCSSLAECPERYRSHLLVSPPLLRQLPNLAGKRLICHCALDAPCHGGVLIKDLLVAVAPVVTDLVLTVGLPFPPSSFVKAASLCRHPFEQHYITYPFPRHVFA